MTFSRRTYAALASALEVLSHSAISELFYRFEAPSDPGEDRSRLSRALALVQDVERAYVVGTQDAVVRELLLEVWPTVQWTERAERLAREFAIDGFAIDSGRLIAHLPSPISGTRGVSTVEASLEGAGLAVVLRHFQQAVGTFADGKFEAANGQLRSAIEAFFREAPGLAGGTPAPDAVAGLQALTALGRIDVKEMQFLKAFWNILHDEGPHSGLTSKQESELRLTYGTSVLRYLLYKLSRATA